MLFVVILLKLKVQCLVHKHITLKVWKGPRIYPEITFYYLKTADELSLEGKHGNTTNLRKNILNN